MRNNELYKILKHTATAYSGGGKKTRKSRNKPRYISKEDVTKDTLY